MKTVPDVRRTALAICQRTTIPAFADSFVPFPQAYLCLSRYTKGLSALIKQHGITVKGFTASVFCQGEEFRLPGIVDNIRHSQVRRKAKILRQQAVFAIRRHAYGSGVYEERCPRLRFAELKDFGYHEIEGNSSSSGKEVFSRVSILGRCRWYF